MMAFVVDASVSIGWIIRNRVTDCTEAAERALATARVHVPTLWWPEMTNILRTGCRRRTITWSEAQDFIKVLDSFPIRVEPYECKASEFFGLALRHDLTGYGAAQSRSGAAPATADGNAGCRPARGSAGFRRRTLETGVGKGLQISRFRP